jgi:pyrroline-5-carboxylate reductase
MAGADALLLVGCGKMGGALLRGWIDGGMAAADVTVVEPAADAVAALGLDPAPAVVAALDDLPADYRPRCIVLAVKPQVMGEVAPGARRFAQAGALVLSIAAGRTIASFAAAVGDGAAIVRAMPNTPAAVGRGITALVANANAGDGDRALAGRLLGAVGAVVWLDDEAQMDAVTAVSGSGPAYVFHLVECLAAAGAAEGLRAETAMTLARATVTGAGELLFRSDDGAETLRRNVTSPGGTTAAALDVLMGEDGLAALMRRAVAAAARRSRELGA